MKEIGTLVIYPKGSLTDRISVMMSVKVINQFLNINLQMIWDHSVPYHVLFVDDIPIVNFEYFKGKNYVYNPNVDQQELIDNIVPDIYSDLHLIVETDRDLKHKDMSVAEHQLLKKQHYLFMLRHHLNGMILGQLNLFDMPPTSTNCFADNVALTKNKTRISTLPIISDNQFPDAKNADLKAFLESLIYCKASLLICESQTVPQRFIDATKISLVPVICLNENVNVPKQIESACAKNFMGHALVINPNIEYLQYF